MQDIFAIFILSGFLLKLNFIEYISPQFLIPNPYPSYLMSNKVLSIIIYFFLPPTATLTFFAFFSSLRRGTS